MPNTKVVNSIAQYKDTKKHFKLDSTIFLETGYENGRFNLTQLFYQPIKANRTISSLNKIRSVDGGTNFEQKVGTCNHPFSDTYT